MRYKYFYKTDKKKERVGTVSAPTLEVAYENAAKVKQLLFKDFVKIFEVEKLKRYGK